MPNRFVSEHGSEVILLWTIAVGVMILCALAIQRNNAAEASAWTAVLMAIINAIKERWMQRSVDRMGALVGQSSPVDPGPVPHSAAEGAHAVAEAAEEVAQEIEHRAEGRDR